MAKYSTNPTLYDDCLRISLSKLKELGYVKSGCHFSGTLNWNRNNRVIASISISINMEASPGYIGLEYKSNDEPMKYIIWLDAVPSNLNRGNILYFVCPSTGYRCRYLHLYHGRFVHRKAMDGAMYQSQTYSHKTRGLCKHLDNWKHIEALEGKLSNKYAKKWYNGQPTKRYKKVFDLYRQSRPFSIWDYY